MCIGIEAFFIGVIQMDAPSGTVIEFAEQNVWSSG